LEKNCAIKIMTKVKIVLLQKNEHHVNAKNKSTIIYIMKFIIYSKLNKILVNYYIGVNNEVIVL